MSKRSVPASDLSLLEKPTISPADLHAGQVRKSGDPYMIHPVSVTNILADRNMDFVTLQTALLHDVVEDTDISVEDLRTRIRRAMSPVAWTASPS